MFVERPNTYYFLGTCVHDVPSTNREGSIIKLAVLYRIVHVPLFFTFRSLVVGQFAEERMDILIKSNIGKYLDINNVCRRYATKYVYTVTVSFFEVCQVKSCSFLNTVEIVCSFYLLDRASRILKLKPKIFQRFPPFEQMAAILVIPTR